MIAFEKSHRRTKSTPAFHSRFLAMLPQIREQARIAFRSAKPEAQEELITEVIANAFVAFARLIERGKADLAYPTPLARFAVRQVCAGRRVGTKLNVRDVSSHYAQLVKSIRVERLDRFDDEQGEWRQALIEDRKAGPAEIAASRIDVGDWFKSLGRGKCKIAKTLARGEATSTVARMFGVTAGRISQLRQELKQSWELFQSQAAVE
jgi:hypothetical protein